MPRRFGSITKLVWVALVSFGVCFAILAAASPRKAPQPKPEEPQSEPSTDAGQSAPSPDMSPGEVVEIVVEALKNNDPQDSGIATTFKFASPSNKVATGPLERFAPMVKTPAYTPLLNHQSAEYGALMADENVAEISVTVIDTQGNPATYLFRLSKQANGELTGCWMTDSVTRLEADQRLTSPKHDDKTPVLLDRA